MQVCGSNWVGAITGRVGAQATRDVTQIDVRVHVYTFPNKFKLKALNAVIIGTIIFFDQMTSFLFNPSSTFVLFLLNLF